MDTTFFTDNISVGVAVFLLAAVGLIIQSTWVIREHQAGC
jgi:hypothetical protein